VLALATQGWFLKKSTPLETALFALSGILLVFPAIISVIVQPLLGIDINAFVPGLSAFGVRLGYNVLLGLLVFAAGFLIQRARPA
jgi:hypothetical protein